jgi:hypothetical protein
MDESEAVLSRILDSSSTAQHTTPQHNTAIHPPIRHARNESRRFSPQTNRSEEVEMSNECELHSPEPGPGVGCTLERQAHIPSRSLLHQLESCKEMSVQAGTIPSHLLRSCPSRARATSLHFTFTSLHFHFPLHFHFTFPFHFHFTFHFTSTSPRPSTVDATPILKGQWASSSVTVDTCEAGWPPCSAAGQR